MRRPPCHLRVLTLVLMAVACFLAPHASADGEVFLTEFRIAPADPHSPADAAWRASVVDLLRDISAAVSLANVTFVLEPFA